LARVILLPPLCDDFFAGREEIEVDGGTIFALVRMLDAMAPGFGEAAEERAAIALNGQVLADWTTHISAGDEVLFVPKLAGG
jgi:molybdopterin converting factor small subunit